MISREETILMVRKPVDDRKSSAMAKVRCDDRDIFPILVKSLLPSAIDC